MIFSGIVGHAPQRDVLARALARGAVHPAYLFSGPPGIGKRLVALEVARAWLCQRGEAGPCGACGSCRAVGVGSHPDFVMQGCEEGKKSIGVKAIHHLTDWLFLSPAWGCRKVALVDPADALTHEAANALLKTLEEPPPGRVVMLVSTRPGGLPATVRSRCQHLAFGPLADEEVAETLRRNGWPAQAARQAAALAEGSPGAALARDGKAWLESADAVRAVLEALERGERGAALAVAERLGEGRERVLLALQALLAFARRAARGRFGAVAEDTPRLLQRLGAEELGRLMAGALEMHRRLEGDRPPNAKLALATLLLGCVPGPRAPAGAGRLRPVAGEGGHDRGGEGAPARGRQNPGLRHGGGGAAAR